MDILESLHLLDLRSRENILNSLTQGIFLFPYEPIQQTFSFHFILISVFYWRIVDLQRCVSFWCTAKWLSYTYIYIFSYSFPWWLITQYWIESPVLYSRTLLFIHPVWNSLHLLIPTSQSMPHPALATIGLVCFCFIDNFICVVF